jgi:ADP-ribosylglycohydrolase
MDAAALEPLLRERFMAWAVSDENDRAPGMTCMRAIGRLADGAAWVEATEHGSKGCGANIRDTPVGLMPSTRSPASPARSPERRTAWASGRPTGRSSTPKN